jgi:hypothetical protein
MRETMIKVLDFVFRLLAVGASLLLIPGAWWNLFGPVFWTAAMSVLGYLVYALFPRRRAAKSTTARMIGLALISMTLATPLHRLALEMSSKYLQSEWTLSAAEGVFSAAILSLFFFATRSEQRRA